MNKKKKIVIILSSLVITIFAFVYNLSQTVSNKELSKDIYENVSLLLEKSIIKHGKIDVSYGWNLKFTIPKFEVLSKTDNKSLIKIESIEVKAPMLSIFFPGFPVKYYFKSMKIFSGDKFDETINIKKLQERMTYKNLFGIKTFKEGSKHQVMIEGTEVISKDISFPIQSIQINNFSWSRPVAYEIKHRIEKSQLIPDLYVDYSLIGEVDLGKAIEMKSLRTKSQIKISSIKIGEVITVDQRLNGTISLHVAGKDNFDGHVSTSGSVDLDSRFFIKNGILDLRDLKLKIPVENVSTISYLIPDPGANNRVSITGEIIGIGSNKVTPKFEFMFVQDIASKLKDFSFTSSFKGIVEENKMTATFESKFTEGEFVGEFRAPVFNKKTGLLFRLDNEIELDLVMKNVDLKTMSLKRKSFYSILKDFTTKNELGEKFKLVNLSISECRFGEELLSGSGTILKTPEGMKSEKFKLNFGEGNLAADFELNKKYIELDLKMDKFNLDGIASITNDGHLPVRGVFTGSFRGVYSKSDQFSHEFDIDLTGRDGELDKGQSITSVGSAVEKISPELKLSKNANAFKIFNLKGKFSNNKFVAQKIFFEDKKEELRVSGRGEVTITDVSENNFIGENSTFMISLFDIKKKLWTKEDSINLPQKIPLKIKRVNGEWLPDLLYTINKIKAK